MSDLPTKEWASKAVLTGTVFDREKVRAILDAYADGRLAVPVELDYEAAREALRVWLADDSNHGRPIYEGADSAADAALKGADE